MGEEKSIPRYWVFAGAWYYPGMALSDLAGRFETLAQAEEVARDCINPNRLSTQDWAIIVDAMEGSEIRKMCSADSYTKPASEWEHVSFEI